MATDQTRHAGCPTRPLLHCRSEAGIKTNDPKTTLGQQPPVPRQTPVGPVPVDEPAALTTAPEHPLVSVTRGMTRIHRYLA
uniref:Uncharacterized protein n=1 Tax=Arundo donax TaxID=35708 RepID=A0A0A8ZXS2_ARUDO